MKPREPAIRLGVIGAGLAFDKLHWPVLQRMPGLFRVTAIASRTRERAEAVAKNVGGARAYNHYPELLQDPEVAAVLIAVPIEVNHSVLMDAMRSGKHVLAEKPIAATPEEGLAVLRMAASGAVVAIAENFRYRKDLAKALEILAKGLVGDVFAFQATVRFDLDAGVRSHWTAKQWRREPRYPGGFLLDSGIHVVSFLRDLLGEVREVYAQVLDRHPMIGGPDSLLMQWKPQNNVVGQYFACYTAKAERETALDVTVYGGRGTIEITAGKVSWTIGAGTHGSGTAGGAFRIPKSDRGFERQWENFANAIRGKEELISTPFKAYRDVLVIDAALRSAASGQPVVIPE
jgi:predicted dehydrogenase